MSPILPPSCVHASHHIACCGLPSLAGWSISLSDAWLNHTCAHVSLWGVSRCTISRDLQWACSLGLILLNLCPGYPDREWEACGLSQPRSASQQIDKPQTYEQAQPRSAEPSSQPPAESNTWTINTYYHMPLRFCGHLLPSIPGTTDKWYSLPAGCI